MNFRHGLAHLNISYPEKSIKQLSDVSVLATVLAQRTDNVLVNQLISVRNLVNQLIISTYLA